MRAGRTIGVVMAAGMMALGGCSGGGWSDPWEDDNTTGNEPPASQPPVTRDRSEGEGTPSQPVDPRKEKDAAKDAMAGTSMVGVLRGGIMGVGGEHTGFVLSRDGKPDAEVDMSRVADSANFVNKRVVIKGSWIDKKYVERGVTPVFVVQSITLKDAARY
jgi:hypothetical protein